MKKSKLLLLGLLPLVLASCGENGGIKNKTYEEVSPENQQKMSQALTNVATAEGLGVELALNNYSMKFNQTYEGETHSMSVSNLKGSAKVQYANLDLNDLTKFEGLLEINGLKGTIKSDDKTVSFKSASLGAYVKEDTIYLNSSDEALRNSIKNIIMIGLGSFTGSEAAQVEAMIDQMLEAIPEKAKVTDMKFTNLVELIASIIGHQSLSTYEETEEPVVNPFEKYIQMINALNDEIHFYGITEREDGGLDFELTITKATLESILNMIFGPDDENTETIGYTMGLFNSLGVQVKMSVSKELLFESLSVKANLDMSQKEVTSEYTNTMALKANLDASVKFSFNQPVEFPSDLSSYEGFEFSSIIPQ